MTDRNHPALNELYISDKYCVTVHNLALNVWFAFQVCHVEGKAPQFTCHMYDSPNKQYTAHISTSTVASDGHGNVRCCGTGRTLDELIYHIDWAHKPSELAMLRQLLASRVLTNNGLPVEDLVLLQLTPEQMVQAADRRSSQAQDVVEEQAEALMRKAQSIVSESKESAVRAARFGLRQPVTANFSE